jgi:hypothetical protein
MRLDWYVRVRKKIIERIRIKAKRKKELKIGAVQRLKQIGVTRDG